MKKSKKLLTLLMAIVLVFGVVSSAMVASAADTQKHLSYNQSVSKKNVDDFVGILDDMVKDLIPTLITVPDFTLDLDAFSKGEYYTNRNLLELVRTIGKLLNSIEVTDDLLKGLGLPEDMLPLVGSILTSVLQNGPYAFYASFPGMKAELDRVAEANGYKAGSSDAESYLSTPEAWDELNFSNIYLGFQDGNREGFLHCLYTSLSSHMLIIQLAEMFAQIPILMGGTGLYAKTVIPVFQALGITDYLAPDKYVVDQDKYNEAAKKGDTEAAVYVSECYLAPILEPALDAVEQLAAKPVETLLSKLPNLLYSFEQGRLDEVIGMLEGIEGAGDIIGMIKNADGSINHDIVGLLNGTINSITGTLVPGVAFGLPELKLNWSDVMKKNGTVTVPAAAGQKDPQYVINPSDASDVFLYVFNYAADALAMEGNQRLIQAVLILLGLDEDTSKMILEIVGMDRQDLLVTVMSLLGVEGLESPDDKNDPTTDPSKDPDADGGSGNGGSGDAEIPQTGDVALSAFAMLAVAGAAGLVITKKKED